MRRAEGRGLGVGSGVSALVPAGSRGAGSPARCCRAFCSRCGERRGGRGGLSSSYTRTHASPSLTHTRSHSLTHSLSHTLKQKGSAAQQPVPPQRREGGDSRNTATAVAKTSRKIGLPPGLPAACSAAPVWPCRGPHLEDRVEEAGYPLPKAAARRTTWTVPTAAWTPDYNAQNAQATVVAAPSMTPPHTVVIGERCMLGSVVQDSFSHDWKDYHERLLNLASDTYR
ncbi:uncharacterized protein [Callorhinus ursinus]|uniref:uncharacterized protein n=1 Tax=Callorhinus ursinus TaxID=34884 RepID=UPI003CCFF92E